ncbi:MORN repeat-containing protein 1 isoform X1 [Alligator mississippiensis]|uniref:MORN repeat-containing protein 1 n=1 Tax=Alligator mississippiensis TaxID=8496 RepID=A0A151N3Q5_ALLMI|nr:MORN repeat-containing protein 1 isoform X1 [Alligator mississippiensis]KYO31431.1 MORN repeat-containing protein 1 [Alligator mississippiensis]
MAASRSGSYSGGLRARRRDGYGLYVYPNTFFQYEGEWRQGKKHGHGKLLFKDGSYYEGEFVDGEILGNGLRYWASSGNTYSGQFMLGELHGHGVMQYRDGGKYEGEFSCGMREGYGLLVDSDGQIYQGSFHKNKKHGGGKMTFKNGDKYEGDWILDQRQGHGELHCADGSVYEGQWRNDMFNGQGTIIHCSGVIYDGLWINGYPAAQAKKIVILGPEVIDIIQGSSITLHVQLQNEEGEVCESEEGRVLEIWAGIRDHQIRASSPTNLFELIEEIERKPVKTPFGFECISYPLMDATSESQKLKAAFPIVSKSGFAWADLSIPKRVIEPESGSDTMHGAGDAPSNQDVFEDERPCPPASQRVEHGCAIFRNILLAPPPANYLSFLLVDEVSKKGGRKPSDRISAEKAEKMTVLQEKIGDSRSEMTPKRRELKNDQCSMKNCSVLPGKYVLMVHEVTIPPFLGKTLPPAFKLLRVLPEKTKNKKATSK